MLQKLQNTTNIMVSGRRRLECVVQQQGGRIEHLI